MSAALKADELRGMPYIPVDRSMRLRGAAVVRILFGVLWAIDAYLKWRPSFIHGQVLAKDLNPSKIPQPLHSWVQLWHDISAVSPAGFAVFIACVETLIAVAMIFGFLSNLTFIGTAIYSFGVWTAPEHIHLPWAPGNTDLGPSIGYIFAALALFFAAAGSIWSVDAVIRPRLGRLAFLAG
jgi:thiosulfate dehydrogenase (quinone) large subunit